MSNTKKPGQSSLSKKYVAFVHAHREQYPDPDGFLSSLNQWPVKAARANRRVANISDLCDVWKLKPDIVPWCPDATYFEYHQRLGNTPEHANGLCYVGDPSAMLLVECLEVRHDAYVVDMCAAPGGKSAHILNKLSHTGTLVANDISGYRAKILQKNLERMCTLIPAEDRPYIHVVSMSIPELSEMVKEQADIVILDAPCSGEALMRRSYDARRQWSEKLITKMSILQKQLLYHASQMLNDNGVVGYSTCTFNSLENEEVCLFGQETLQLIHVDLSNRFDGNIPVVAREHGLILYPHQVQGDGQSVFVMHR